MHGRSYYDGVLAIEITKKSFFNYDAHLTSVITMELSFIFFFVDVNICDVINVKNFRENFKSGHTPVVLPEFVSSCLY